MKTCRTCNLEKPLNQFHKNNASSDKKQSHCKPCSIRNAVQWRKDNPVRAKVTTDKWNRLHKDQKHTIALKRKYGITQDQFQAMLQAQGGLCGVCKQPESEARKMSVDHNHTNGKVRDLLCKKCNSGLGMFLDSSSILTAALEYLKKHESVVK